MIAQPQLFADVPDAPAGRALPVIGEQKDIRYLAAAARGVLNPPAATGMPYWSLNPYVGCAFGCTYCYARYAHQYQVTRALDVAGDADTAATELRELAALPPWLAFERRILVKENAPRLVRQALRPGTAKHQALTGGDTVVVGTATDPYQPAERRFRLTRGVLEALAEHAGLSVVIITKSPLVTRDVDVLRAIADRSRLSVHVSLITVERDLARRLEPRAPTPEARLRAIRRLRAAGIAVVVNCMPVLPGITDAPPLLARLVAAVADAGATHLAACALRLRASARRRYLPFVAREFPALAARYQAAYAAGHQPGARYRDGLRRTMRRLCERHGLHYGMPDDGSDDETAALAAAARAAVTQMELGL